MSELDAYREAVARRREAIMERVDAALAQSGRKAGSVKVMAVSKTVDVPQVVVAIDAARIGLRSSCVSLRDSPCSPARTGALPVPMLASLGSI